MKVHGGNCRPSGGGIPCEGQHMYYCALCKAPFTTDASTRTADSRSGAVYPSPSYPACTSAHLASLQAAGKFLRPRVLGKVGAPIAPTVLPSQINQDLPDADGVPKGA